MHTRKGPGHTPWRSMLWVFACLWGAITAQAAAAAVGNVVLENDYVSITVNARENNMGRFYIGTTGGDPERTDDNRQPLMYGVPDPGPWTSYTTIRVDGKDYVFGGKTTDRAGRSGLFGKVVTPPTRRGNQEIVTVFQEGPVEVTQSLSFVRSTTTGLLDTVRIAYTVKNTDTAAHDVGLRMLLDTMLGNNDGAPFRVGEREVTADVRYTAANMPEFWQAFDSLQAPKVTAQGTLKGEGVTTPDVVYFTNWGVLADGVWDFDFRPGRDFTRTGEFDLDSALALFWNPAGLAPGQSRTYVTHLGLGGITIAPGRLSVGLTAPAEVVGGGQATFPLLAYVLNSGTGEARNVKVRLTLPNGFTLAGEPAERSLGDLPVGKTAQVQWTVRVPERAVGEFTFQAGVTAENSDPNRVERAIRVVAPAQLSVDVTQQTRVMVRNDQWTPFPIPVKATIRNTGGTVATDVVAEWSSPLGLQLAEGDRARKAIGQLGPGESYEVTWHVIPVGYVGNLPYNIQAVAGNLKAVNTGLIEVPMLHARIGIETEVAGRPGNQVAKVGDYVSVTVAAANVPDFYGVTLDLLYDPNVLELVGGPNGVDRGRLFVRSAFESPTGAAELLTWHPVELTVPESGMAKVRLQGNRARAGAVPLANDTIAKLRFKAKQAGYSPLRVAELRVINARGEPVGAIKADGVVRVEE